MELRRGAAVEQRQSTALPGALSCFRRRGVGRGLGVRIDEPRFRRRTVETRQALDFGDRRCLVPETALRELSGFVHSAGERTEMRKLFLAGLVVAALVGFAWLVLRPHEPVYEGKTLGFWLQLCDGGCYNLAHPGGPPAPSLEDANDALRHIGTNALPTLLRMLRERDPEFKFAMMRLLRKQHLIRIPFSSYPRNYTALEALKV